MSRIDPSVDMCAFCDEFSVKDAPPDIAAQGKGRCDKQAEYGPGPGEYVSWNGRTCVTFRLDRRTLAARRQFVEQQRQKSA